MYIRLSACVTWAPSGRIFVKCYAADFYEKLSRKSTFGYNHIKIWGNLHEDITKGGLLFRSIENRLKTTDFLRNNIRLLVWWRRYKHYANAPQCCVIRTVRVLFSGLLFFRVDCN